MFAIEIPTSSVAAPRFPIVSSEENMCQHGVHVCCDMKHRSVLQMSTLQTQSFKSFTSQHANSCSIEPIIIVS